MIKYTLVRLLQTLVVLVGVSLVTFVMVNVVPGDPVALMMEKTGRSRYNGPGQEGDGARQAADSPVPEPS